MASSGIGTGTGDDEAESYSKMIRPHKFSSVFREEDVVLMLEEYIVFAATHKNVKNKWVEFRKQSKLTRDYTVRQISEKFRSLQNKFEKKKKMGSSPPHDPHQARVFELSKSLWGDDDKKSPSPLLMKLNKQEEFEFEFEFDDTAAVTKRRRVEKEKQELCLRELDLYYRKLLLQQEEYQIKMQKLKLSSHFQSTTTTTTIEEKKKIQKKGTLSKKEDLEFKDYKDCKQERSKKLENEVSEKVVMEDLSIACVKDKIEDQPSDCRSKKKKKKSKTKRDHKKGKQVVVETLPCSVAIEELSLGDPNGKFVSSGSGIKVKINFTAKLKDSGHVFESTIGKAPRIIVLGDEKIIDGITIGVQGMRVGGKRRLTIPPSFGFGAEGLNDIVPPNSWLEYEIELIDVRKTMHLLC